MSTVGVCQVCESAEATHTCESCGSLVCEKHYDDAAGVCQQCLGGAR